MSFIRRASGRSLLTFLGTVVAALVVIATAASFALGGGGSPPPAKPLANALHDAAAAPDVQGVSAHVDFTNHLFDSLTMPEGSQPLLKGGSGRLWATDGKLRVELQGDTGDVQIVIANGSGFVYDGGGSNTVYRFTLPQQGDSRSGDRGSPAGHGVPAIAQIQKRIDKASKNATIDGPQPTTVANEPAYSVRITPKDSGGLIGAAELAWDAARGVPLRIAVYARGASTPALELQATDISFGPVPASTFDVQPPAGAQVVDLTGSQRAAQPDHGTGTRAHPEKLPAWLNDPATLAGRARSDAKPTGPGGAVVVYGKGLDAIVVLEHRADNAKAAPKPAPTDNSGDPGTQLTFPTVSIGGANGTQLSTPLGSVVNFERDGISYTVLGSQPASVIETAARGL